MQTSSVRGLLVVAASLVVLSAAVPSAANNDCLRPPQAKADPRPVETIFASARADFEAKRLEEAAFGFREVALTHASTESGSRAATLYIESLNLLATAQRRPACYDQIAVDVPVLRQLYCGPRAEKNPNTCVPLDKVQVDLLWLEAEGYVNEGSKLKGAEATALIEKGALRFTETFQEYCEHPGSNWHAGPASKCDAIGFNAARAFLAAHHVAKAISMERKVIAFDERTKQHSSIATRMKYDIGVQFQALALYDLAAEEFERFARGNPKEPDADVALSDAIILRLALGQADVAAIDASSFARQYGASKPNETARIAIAMATHHAEQEGWTEVRSTLLQAMPALEKASPDLTLHAHRLLARASAFGAPSNKVVAQQEYAKVLALWSNAEDAVSRIRAAYATSPDGRADRELGKALVAVGEAQFAAAEERQRVQVDALPFPVYRGRHDEAHIGTFIETTVSDWAKKRQAAILLVEREYLKVFAIQPAPPPLWTVRAASRVALMWATFAEEYQRLIYLVDRDVSSAWLRRAADALSDPIKAGHAKPAARKCLDLAAKFQVADAFPRACETWLAKNYAAEYHRIDDELLPPLVSGHADRLRPLENGVP